MDQMDQRDSDLECTVPELGDGRLRIEHECKGHWPYDRGCDDCVQLRGRTPARRVGHTHETPHSLAADFLFVAGKHWSSCPFDGSLWHGWHGGLWR